MGKNITDLESALVKVFSANKKETDPDKAVKVMAKGVAKAVDEYLNSCEIVFSINKITGMDSLNAPIKNTIANGGEIK